MNVLSFSLRLVGMLAAVLVSFFFDIGNTYGVILFGVFIGMLIWSLIDLAFELFQERSTQTVNVVVSVASAALNLQFSLSLLFFMGIGIGVVIALFGDKFLAESEEEEY